MNYVEDFDIKNEILPLFDFSKNLFTKSILKNIFENPLKSEKQILDRQLILKGFSENYAVLKNYNYTFLYFNEVHTFLKTYDFDNFINQKNWFMGSVSKSEKNHFRTKLCQVILFFNKLESVFFAKIDLQKLPKSYQPNMEIITDFFNHLKISNYKYVGVKKIKNKDATLLTQSIIWLKSQNKIDQFWNELFQFEAYLSISLGIKKNQFNFPTISKSGISLKQFYHPSILNPIKNDFDSDVNVIILNGPNMSGKSTFLKALGLSVYLGNLGLAIPAKSGKIPFCENFCIQLNKTDNIKKGLSHFMYELKTLKDIVIKANEGAICFGIFDELFNGTNVEDATSILSKTILGLQKFKNSYFFISTHIQEIKTLSDSNIEMYYMECNLENEIPKLTYTVKQGWTDIKIGKLLFEKEGLNKLLH